MRVNEQVGWRGRITVHVIADDGAETETFENTITNDGLNLLSSALRGVDTEIRYLAWGNDSTTPAVTDSALGNELGRKQVTSQSAGLTGVNDTITYLAPGDANLQIEELGWFAGTSASDTADSGVLVARVLYSKLKTDLESIQVDRTDTVG